MIVKGDGGAINNYFIFQYCNRFDTLENMQITILQDEITIIASNTRNLSLAAELLSPDAIFAQIFN